MNSVKVRDWQKKHQLALASLVGADFFLSLYVTLYFHEVPLPSEIKLTFSSHSRFLSFTMSHAMIQTEGGLISFRPEAARVF